MSRVMGIKRLAAGAILAVALFGTACNSVGNKPDWSEAVIQGTALEYTGVSSADPKPVVAKITFAVLDRNQSGLSTSDLNNIEFTSYTMTYSSPFVGTVTGISAGIFYSVPSSGNILLLSLLNKPAAAGTTISVHVHFDGRDNLGRHVEYDIELGTVVTA